MREQVYSYNACGMPERAVGREALLQEAYIRLRMTKGSFPYDREMGSLLHRLMESPAAEREMMALAYAREALLPMAEVQAVDAHLAESSAVEVELEIFGEREKVRVKLQ